MVFLDHKNFRVFLRDFFFFSKLCAHTLRNMNGDFTDDFTLRVFIVSGEEKKSFPIAFHENC